MSAVAICARRTERRRGPAVLGAAVAAVLLGAAAPALAGDVVLEIGPLRDGDGQILVALCDEAAFLRSPCERRVRVAAAAGVNTVRFADVPAGTYAAQVIHDENGNAALDKNFVGIPTEGYGFSRIESRFTRRPSFGESSFTITAEGGLVAVPVTYWL